jgi:hypothetical protein
VVARFRRFDVVVQRGADGTSIEALRERRAGFRTAMGNLERSIAAPAPGRVDAWVIGVRDAVEALRDVVDRHIFATEAPGGFLDELVEEEPRLANQAQRLREEHGEMVDAISAALARLRARPSFATEEWAETMRDRLTVLMALLARHRQRGADLVYEAFDVDLGGGG